MERSKKFLSDINNARCFDRLKIKQFDDLTVEYIVFKNGKELDITGASIEAFIIKPDNTIVVQEDGCAVFGNIIKINLNKECTQVNGLAKLEVKISKDNKQITTFETRIEIEKSIFNNEYARKNLVEVLIALQDSLLESKEQIIFLDKKNDIANENIQLLDEKNTIANSNISELDVKNIIAENNINSLDIRNVTAEGNVGLLDEKNTLAGNNIINLNDKNTVANETKDSLDRWIQENQDLKDLDGRVYNNSSEIRNIKDGIVNGKAIVISEDSPIGTIIWFSGKEINLVDSNIWRVCNGSELNKNEYLDLWNVIGSNMNYGNNGESVFKLPDLVSKKKSINSVDLEYDTGANNSSTSTIATLKTSTAKENSMTMIPFIKISDMSSKGIEISDKLENLDVKTNNNTNEINNMKEAIIQNRPIVITDDTPIGTILWWSSDKINQKLDSNIWKVANGQVLQKVDYPELYELFNGNPNYTVSSAEFALPDLLYHRRFIRSVGHDYNVGFVEQEQFKVHNHLLVNNDGKRINLTPDFDNGVDSGSIDSYHYSRASANKSNNVDSWQASSFTSNEGGEETRPKNMGLVPIIKCKNISENMQSVAQEWTKFKEYGGEIGGIITVHDINLENKSMKEQLGNSLKICNRPYYVQGGVVGVIDLGSELDSGNYILGINLNANTTGSPQYHSSLLYSIQLVTGYENNKISNKVYLNSLGFPNNIRIQNVISHDECRILFATTGSDVKDANQKSSIHIHITPYDSVSSLGFKDAVLYKINI